MGERRVTLSPGVERLVRAAAEPPRCDTCKHWQEPAPLSSDAFYRRDETWRTCALLDSGRPKGIHIWAEHCDEVGFLTAPDFGCTEHAPRAAEEGTEHG